MFYAPPVTGLAALNASVTGPMPRIDDVDPRRQQPKQRHPHDGGGRPEDKRAGAGNMIPAFMPGQQDALADQLNQGFGGGDQQWMAYLSKVFGRSPSGKFNPSGGGGASSGGPPVIVDPRNPKGGKPGTVDPFSTGLLALGGRNF